MRYEVKCPVCGLAYEVNMDFTPGFCTKCGNDLVEVTAVKTKARITAEAIITEMDEIRPRLIEAYEAYQRESIAYEDLQVKLKVYHRRKVITDEEYDRVCIGNYKHRKNRNGTMKEYRKQKSE